MADMDNNPEAEQFRKLFIGGLDYRTTDQSLKQFYEQWGEIVDVVVMKHPQTQKSRGFGFVTYAVASMVDEAMKNRPHKIDGREVDSKRAVPRDASGAANNVNVKKMFVGGLKEQSEDELRDYFGQYGTIIGVNVVVDKITNKRKGYAFIEYNDYDPVDKALLVRDHQVAGKSVTVKKAVVKEGPGGAPGGGRGGRGGGRGGGRAAANSWGSGGAGGGWGGSNGYNGGGGPWDGSQGNGWGGGWDQYGNGGGWNGANAGGGYGGQQGYGGGPVRSNYNNAGQRNAPYGGGYGGGQWGGNNARY